MPSPINKADNKPGAALSIEAARRRALINTKSVFADVPGAKEGKKKSDPTLRTKIKESDSEYYKSRIKD